MLTLEPSVSLVSALCPLPPAPPAEAYVPLSSSLPLQHRLDTSPSPVVDLGERDILVRSNGADPAVHLGLGCTAGRRRALSDTGTRGELRPDRDRDTRQLLAYP